MGSNFYAAGGWGMHPVSIFGFLLIAASCIYVLRPQLRYQRLALVLGLLTFSAGLLGTATGICASARYLEKVEVSKQVQIFALGIEESLHDVVLALILVIIGALIASVGVMRASSNAAVAH